MSTWRHVCDVSLDADNRARIPIAHRQPASWAGWLLRVMPIHDALTMARAVVRTLEAIEVEEQVARERTGT